MHLVVSLIKYIFVVGAGVEVVLILKALYELARDKARAEAPTATPAEE